MHTYSSSVLTIYSNVEEKFSQILFSVLDFVTKSFVHYYNYK